MKEQLVHTDVIREDYNNNDINLPYDFTYTIPIFAKSWIKEYDITDQEILQYHIGWSDSEESLIYPVFAVNGELLMYQSRYMGPTPTHSKYMTFGKPEEIFYFVGKSSNKIVLTEDIISAIKVGRHAYSMPLWGSSISNTRLARLSTMFDELVIWLDWDKARYSAKQQKVASNLFKNVTSLVTLYDPKEYSNDEILRYLQGR